MSPLYRNIAIAAALVAVPAALTAAIGPDRMRTLPGRVGNRVRDWWNDDDLEDNLRNLAGRIDEISDRIDLGGASRRDSSLGLVSSIIGIAVLVPGAIAALAGAGKLDGLQERIGSLVTGGDDDDAEDAMARDLTRLTSRLDALNADLDRQRESAFDAVTKAAHASDG